MKCLFSCALLTLLASTTFAQEEERKPFPYSVKLYNHTTLQGKNSLTFYNQAQRQILHPTFAFQVMTANGNFHEFEISDVSVKQTDYKYIPVPDKNIILQGYKLNHTSVALRYEYIIRLFKTRVSRMASMVGLGASPYYLRNYYSPYITTNFPSTNLQTGIKGYVIPRVTYDFSRRLYLDVNAPICIADASYRKERIMDPSLSVDEQSAGVFDLHMLPDVFTFRIGLGLRL